MGSAKLREKTMSQNETKIPVDLAVLPGENEHVKDIRVLDNGHYEVIAHMIYEDILNYLSTYDYNIIRIGSKRDYSLSVYVEKR